MISKRRILAAVLATSMLVCGIPNVTKAIEYNGATSGNSATSGDTSSDGNTSSSGNTASDGNTSSSGNIASDGNVQEKGKPEITFAIGEDLLINDNGKEYILSEKFSENEDENPKLKVKVKDEKSKISNIIIKVNETEVINNAYKETEQTDETEVDVTLLKNDIVNNAFVINVRAVNANGVETEGEKTIYADVNAPEISENEATIEGGNYVNGIYVGNKIKASININSKNEGNDSSLREVEFYLAKDKDNIKNLADENRVVLQNNVNTTLDYKMDENNKGVYSGYLAVCVKDMCGNVTYKLLSEYKVILENVNPTVSLYIASDNNYKVIDGNKWIKADDRSSIEYKYEINDDNSGIKEYIIKVNNEAISGTEEIEKNSNVEEYTEDGFNKKITGSFKLEGYKPNNEGKYVISIVATDNAGNEIEAATDIINVDADAPVIDGKVEFKNNTNEDENYIYGNKDVTVSFKVKDGDLGSGIDKIEIYKSVDKIDLLAANVNSNFTDKNKCGEATTKIDENGEVTCTIKAPAEGEDAFENYMYAKLYDNVGNYRYVDLLNKKLILEKNKPEIIVTKLSSENIPGDYLNKLIGKNIVGYKIIITDKESKINKYTIFIDNKEISPKKVLNVENESITFNVTTQNIVKYPYINPYIVKVIVTDKAGNEKNLSLDEEIGIDKKAPEINEIKFSNKNGEEIKVNDGNLYNNDNVKIEFVAKDDMSGVCSVEVYAVDKNSKDDTSKYEKIEKVNFSTTDGKVTFEVASTDSKYKYYYAKVYDYANNNSEYVLLSKNGLLIESKAPEVVNDTTTFYKGNKKITPIEGKVYSNNTVTVNFKVTDTAPSSGISKVEVYAVDEMLKESTDTISEANRIENKLDLDENGKVTFEVTGTDDKYKYYYAKVYDNARNDSGYVLLSKNGLLIESKAPEVVNDTTTFYKGNKKITPIEGKVYSNNTVTVNFKVTDTAPSSGISKVEVYAVDENSKDDTSKYKKIENVTFSTRDGKVAFEVASTDDKYKYYYAKVYDNANNNSGYVLLSENGLLIESKAPEVVKNTTTFYKGNKKITPIEGKAYSNNTVTVNFKVTDTAPSSGISKVEVYAVDENSKDDTSKYKKIENVTFSTRDGKVAFEVASTDDKYKYYYAKVYDNAENDSGYVLLSENGLLIEKKAPEVVKDTTTFYKDNKKITPIEGKVYSNNKVTVNFKVTDTAPSSGISEVEVYAIDENSKDDTSKYKKIENVNFSTTDGKVTFEVAGTDDKYKYYYAKVYDNAENISDYILLSENGLLIESKAPEVKPESVKFENITKISDNIYANNTVKVNFEVTDAEPSSGISKVEVYAVDKNSKDDTSKYEKIENVNFLTTDGKVTFEVAGTDDKYKYYYAKVYDNAENISDYILLSENGLLIESKAPEVEKLESSEENGEYTVGKAKWINGNGVIYNYEIKDDKNVTNYSGIASYTIKVQGPNDENLITIYPTEDKKYNFKELVSSVSGNFKFTPKEPGKYTIIIEMMDNAGNTNVYKHEVNADLSMPTASKFSMSFDKYAEGNSESVKTEKYGYYFKSKAQVTVTLTDDGHSSGIREAAYFLYDVKNNMSASDFVKAGNYNTTTKINNNQITIDIPENFKGQIYVAAIDNVGNGDFTNINNYTKPAGIIIDDNRNDKDVIAINRLKTSFKDNSGLDLYNKDIQVGFNIKDVTSGIRRIDWNVSSANGGESNYSGYMEINNDGKISGNNDNYNVITKEQNLITSLAKSISVGNNDNAITVTIKVEDRAGNISYATDTFSIDKTTPEITIEYDNNTPDVANSKMFKADRKATITVRERNFNPKDVVIDIKNTDGVIPVLSDWRVINGTGNGDNTTYTASISYVNDGDYTFAMGYQDNAANVANINFTAGTVEATEFTIDKTRPTLSVQYNNNLATNGNYYLDQRIATFTIVEHNFDASRFELSISRNGAASQQSVNWTNNGDTHTASIALDEEVLYNIFANYTDMAGNAIEGTYNAEFYVDKKAPDLIISGIDNEKAYRDGRVGFVISSSDTYFDSVSISLELLNRDGSTTTLISNNDERANVHIDYQNIENGRKLSVENLETDGIYRLMCRATDKAGRVTENNVLFSININGPTYYIDDEATLNIKDKYLVSPQDIVFNEINVNELKPDTIKITVYRGNTTWDLVEGRDYTVEKVEGIDKWCKYRYIISKDNFKENGIYHVTIASKDIVENDAISEKFSFVIDNEPPVCTVFDLKAGNVYVTNSKDVRFKVTDNIELDSLIVLLDGKEIMKLSGDDIKKNVSEDGTIKITIPSSNKAQNLVIKYTDKSGNESETEVKGFYITTNLWIRFINNKPLVISICCAIAAIIILIILIIIRKNKKDNKKTNTKAVSNKKE